MKNKVQLFLYTYKTSLSLLGVYFVLFFYFCVMRESEIETQFYFPLDFLDVISILATASWWTGICLLTYQLKKAKTLLGEVLFFLIRFYILIAFLMLGYIEFSEISRGEWGYAQLYFMMFWQQLFTVLPFLSALPIYLCRGVFSQLPSLNVLFEAALIVNGVIQPGW